MLDLHLFPVKLSDHVTEFVHVGQNTGDDLVLHVGVPLVGHCAYLLCTVYLSYFHPL